MSHTVRTELWKLNYTAIDERDYTPNGSLKGISCAAVKVGRWIWGGDCPDPEQDRFCDVITLYLICSINLHKTNSQIFNKIESSEYSFFIVIIYLHFVILQPYAKLLRYACSAFSCYKSYIGRCVPFWIMSNQSAGFFMDAIQTQRSSLKGHSKGMSFYFYFIFVN